MKENESWLGSGGGAFWGEGEVEVERKEGDGERRCSASLGECELKG